MAVTCRNGHHVSRDSDALYCPICSAPLYVPPPTKPATRAELIPVGFVLMLTMLLLSWLAWWVMFS